MMTMLVMMITCLACRGLIACITLIPSVVVMREPGVLGGRVGGQMGAFALVLYSGLRGMLSLPASLYLSLSSGGRREGRRRMMMMILGGGGHMERMMAGGLCGLLEGARGHVGGLRVCAGGAKRSIAGVVFDAPIPCNLHTSSERRPIPLPASLLQPLVVVVGHD